MNNGNISIPAPKEIHPFFTKFAGTDLWKRTQKIRRLLRQKLAKHSQNRVYSLELYYWYFRS